MRIYKLTITAEKPKKRIMWHWIIEKELAIVKKGWRVSKGDWNRWHNFMESPLYIYEFKDLSQVIK